MMQNNGFNLALPARIFRGIRAGSERSLTNKKFIISIVLSCLLFSQTLLAATSLTISQVPLILVTPSRPQVLIVIGNSQSMDGTLSGAIMTGSGALSLLTSSLSNSSSPTNYVVPSGFTPPVQAANSSGQAPYTVSQNNVLYDNSASRLNVAKAAIRAIITAYLPTTDFAFEDYSTSGTSLYTTWVYYISSASNNFTFTNNPIAGNRYVINPCYRYTLASLTVTLNCTLIAPFYNLNLLLGTQYMQIGASSDDPTINDVLYGSGLSSIFLVYNGPTPVTPYPPNFSLANYNNNAVSLNYKGTLPFAGAFDISPTNAGFVPYSPQVMFSQRGFGYKGNASATTGNILVPMTNLGTNPTTTALNAAINLFAPYLRPETNTLSSTEIKSSASQSPVAGLLSRAQTYLTGLSPSSSTCPSKKYIIFISDGLPTQDLNGKSWPPLGSAAALGYGVTATFNADGSLNTTNNQAVTDTITALTNLNAAGIKTYVIGLGAGVDPSVNPQAASTLTAMAMAGGTIAYYPATDSTSLVNNLNTILTAVQSGTLVTTSAATSSSHIQTGPTEYTASYISADTPYQDWTGNLVAQNLDPMSGMPVGAAVWSAQTLLDAQVLGTGWLNSRLIVTWNPTLSNGVGDGTPFAWANLSTAQKALLQPSDALGANRVQYLRGNTALEIRNGGVFRNRSHILGDIVDSAPLYVGAPTGAYFSIPSYATYLTAQANRQAMVYVGANDGMLHAFNATTGAEKFAFVPNGVMQNLDNLTAATYNQSHLFFVNGSVQSGDVQFSDATWHTLIVGGEGAGGNSIYALDVTTPSTLSTETNVANAVLWEFTDTDMGLSYSAPQIAPINPSTTSLQTFAVFFGNGYNSPNNKAVLYAVDPRTGSTLIKIDLCAAVAGACNANLPQGLSTVAVGNLDGIPGQAITQVYAGDLQGNLWAIDVSNAAPSQWRARLLFKARDASANPQPITTQPVVSLHPLFPRLQGLFVMFGTGQFLTVSDLTSTQTQTVYGVWDKPAANTVFTRTNLQAQTLTYVSAAASGLPQDILTNTSTTVSWASSVGWYDDLVIAGQRVISDPQLLNGALITILITPPVNLCASAFTSVLFEVSYLTGGAFFRPQLDINGSGTITSADQYNGSYPVGVGLPGLGLVTGLAIFPTPNANNNIVKLLSGSGGQGTVINPNNMPRMGSWWQIQ